MVDRETIKLGTRGSRLALWQAHHIAGRIRELGQPVELVILKTKGDRDQSKPVTELGGVGVFVKELERALSAGEVDLAVHSLKDLPTDLPEGLAVAAYPGRERPHELLIMNPRVHAPSPPSGPDWLPLAEGARIGTASLRRRAQLLELRPDLKVAGIRGNVPTRVDKARTGEVDAVVLAAAGVDRLELALEGLIRVDLPLDHFLPAPGQGALAIEVRADDAELLALLAQLDLPEARESTGAERGLLNGLGAGCSVPLGTRAWRDERGICLEAILQANPPGHEPSSEVVVMRRAFVRCADPATASAEALRILGPQDLLPTTPEGLKGRRILIGREPEAAGELASALRAAGATSTCQAPTRFELRGTSASWSGALSALAGEEGAWVLFASARAVRAASELSEGSLRDALAAFRIGAVGPATARALACKRVPVDLLAPAGATTGAGLADALLAHLGQARPTILLPAAEGGRPELGEALTSAGCEVTRIELYASEPASGPASSEGVDAILLASPSGARVLLEGHSPGSIPPLVAIGPTTASAIEDLGHSVAATAANPTLAGQVEALREALS